MIKRLINLFFKKNEKSINNTTIRTNIDSNPFFEFDQ